MMIYKTNLAAKIGRMVLSVLFSMALASCAVGPKQEVPIELSGSRNYVQEVSLKGKLLIIKSGAEKIDNSTLRYEWDQSSDKVEVTAYSPFGQVIAKIAQDQSGASLQLSRDKTFHAANLEQLMAEQLRWSLPVTQLKAWMQGFEIVEGHILRPISSSDALLKTADGWVVRFAQWEAHGDSFRPQRIEISKPYLNGEDLRLVITIAEWN